jgi:preprotein translocase subunit SecG
VLSFILLLHILVCVGIVALVLLQQGKGADVGAAFGSGSSNTIFGSRGPASFLFKLTAFLVLIFFITSVTLTYLQGQAAKAANELTAPIPANTQNLPVNNQPFIPPAPNLPAAPTQK